MPGVDDLELSVRTSNVLRNYGITTIEQFLALERGKVMTMKNAGVKTWREIAEVQQYLHGPTVEALEREAAGEFHRLVYRLNELMTAHPKFAVIVQDTLLVPCTISKSYAETRFPIE